MAGIPVSARHAIRFRAVFLFRRFQFAAAIAAVAVGAALFAIGFRYLLGQWYASVFHAPNVVTAITRLPWWGRVLLPAVGGAIAGLISRLRPTSRQGVSNVMEAVALGRVHLSMRTTLARVLASGTAIAAGMSIGREGPLIEFGGALGASLGRISRVSRNQTRVLVAAGTAAGFAAAYNTPFAAVLFVFETIVGIAAPAALLPTMAATVIAAGLTRALVGAGPIYGQRSFSFESFADVVWITVLGLLAAVVAAMFKWTLSALQNLFEEHPIAQPWRAALGGTVVGLLALWLPEVAGNGYEPLNLILDQRLALGIVGALLAAKIASTSSSVSSGVPGGIFTPMLLVGAATGTLLARIADLLPIGPHASAGSYALVGMAATTAASMHAPLTAAVLAFELSGDYAIVLPLLAATTISTVLSRYFGTRSVYEEELHRKGIAWELTLEGRRLSREDGTVPRAGDDVNAEAADATGRTSRPTECAENSHS